MQCVLQNVCSLKLEYIWYGMVGTCDLFLVLSAQSTSVSPPPIRYSCSGRPVPVN